jgi:hypothetical protein
MLLLSSCIKLVLIDETRPRPGQIIALACQEAQKIPGTAATKRLLTLSGIKMEDVCLLQHFTAYFS